MSFGKKKSSSTPSAPAPPAFAPSEIYYGDDLIAESKKVDGIIQNRYNPSAQEQQIQSYTDDRLAALLPQLGFTGPEMSAQFDQIAQDYTDQQTDKFTKQYQKTMRNLQEDTAARFGTLKASPYVDNIRTLTEEAYIPAIQNINRDASLLKNDLFNQDMQRKLQELNALGFQSGAGNQQFQQGLNNAFQGSNVGNAHNQNVYNANLNAYNAAMNTGRARSGGFVSGLFGSLF